MPSGLAGILNRGYDPNDPFGGLASGRGGDYGRITQGLIGRAGQAGFFDPMGSRAIRDAIIRRGRTRFESQRRRQSTLGQLAGLDPYQRRVAMLDTERMGGQGLADELNDLEAQQLLGNQDYFRSLYGGERDFQRQMQAQRAAERASRRGALGGTLGRLAGAAAGFIPGIGPVVGAAGGNSRAPRMGEDNFRYYRGGGY